MIRRLRHTVFALLLASPFVASVAPAVETQANISEHVKKILVNYAHVPSGDVAYVMAALGIPKIYATATELTTAAPAEGTLGYASDTNAFYLRVGSSWTAIASLALLENGATWTNAVDGTVTLTEGGENLQIVVTSNLITLTSSTGATIAITPAVQLAGALGVTGLTTATGGLSTTKPLFVYDKLRFCGNGSNGATPWYDGPVTEAEGETDFAIGTAACDGNDSGTEGTADRPMDAYTTFKVVGMACVTQAGGTSDTNTFALHDDTAAVAGMTCAVTNDGANPKTCSVILAAPVTVAAASELGIANVQSGTDDMSAKDMGCTVYYTY